MDNMPTASGSPTRTNCYSCRYANAAATTCSAPLRDRETRKAWGAWLRETHTETIHAATCAPEATGCPVWAADELETLGASL